VASQTSVDALPERRKFRVSPVQVLAFVFIGLIVFWLGANLIDDPTHFLDLFLVGLTIGMVYALIALGYSLVYGILELINFAHGDVFMLGGMMTVTLVSAFGLGASGNVLVWIVPMLVITAAFTGS
jgi:branched-chain amino acid transport system permease protein